MSKRTTLFIRIFSLNFLLLLLSTLLFQTCSDDNSPTEPEAQPSLAAATIGSGGGTLKTDDFELIVPVGAFPTDIKLTLKLVENEDSGFDNIVSREFQLEGLPTTFEKPLTIKIKYSGELTDSSYIAIGEKVWVSSLNDETVAYHLLSANDSSGYLSTKIAPAEENNSSLGKSSSTKNGDYLIRIHAASGEKPYMSNQKHFKIVYQSSVNESHIQNLAAYLETAYAKFKSLGFKYNKRTSWPVEVTVKKLESTVFGYYINSMWGDNYGYMEFNSEKMRNAEEMKVTAGHEFFHLVQSLYDPRNRYSKAKFKSSNYWINEASSVWAETLFSNDSNFVSDVFILNADFAFAGAKLEKENPEEYGYGCASLIEFLTNKHNDKILLRIYEEIFNGSNSFQAINSVIPTKVDLLWDEFLTELFTFRLYEKRAQFTSVWLYSTAKSGHALFEIKNESDTNKTFSKKLTDLSAYIFAVKNSNDAVKANSDLNFELSGTSHNRILLFKQNGNESVFLKQGENSVTLESFKSITDAGYNIIAVVSNNKFNAPYTDVENINLTIKVKNKEVVPFPIITEIVDERNFLYNNTTHNFSLPYTAAMIRGENLGINSKVFINGIESTLQYSIYDDSEGTFVMPEQPGNISVKVVSDAGESNEYSYYCGIPLSYLASAESVEIKWRLIVNNFSLPLYLNPSDEVITFSKDNFSWSGNILTVDLGKVPNISGSIQYTFAATGNKVDYLRLEYNRSDERPNEVVHYLGEDFVVRQPNSDIKLGFRYSNQWNPDLLNRHTTSMTGTTDYDEDGNLLKFNSLRTLKPDQLMSMHLNFNQ